MWTPPFADAHYGILPLVTGMLLSTLVALSRRVPRSSRVINTVARRASSSCFPRAFGPVGLIGGHGNR
jgi:ABC-type phosphate transport system permease subunit